MADLFISYATEDRARVRPLVEYLQKQGWSVWWDREIPAGTDFGEVIDEELQNARCVVVVWSEASTRSPWVKDEATEGRKRRILVPVLLDRARIPLSFRLIQAARLIDWEGEEDHPELLKLRDAIAGKLGKAPPPLPEPPPPPRRIWPALAVLAIVGSLLLLRLRPPGQEIHALQLVPDSGLYQLLPKNPEPEATRYELLVEHDGGAYPPFEGINAGLLVLGGTEPDLQQVVEEETEEGRRRPLQTHFRVLVADQRARDTIIDLLLDNTQYLPTERFERGDRIRVRLLCTETEAVLAEGSYRISEDSSIQNEYLEGIYDVEDPCGFFKDG